MFLEKFLSFLKEDEIILSTKKTITEDIEAYAIAFGDTFTYLVNPISGTLNDDNLFMYVKQFTDRGKDIIILKSDSKDKPFFAFDRGEFASYLASSKTTDDFEDLMKDMKKKVEWVYTEDNKKELFDSYVEDCINSLISITINDPEKVYPTNNPNFEKED